MVSTLTEGHVEWTMAAPLWPSIGSPSDASERVRFRTPTILRFTTDTFMDDFHNLLAVQPSQLNQYVAAPETWSSPPNDPVAPLEKQGLALVLQRARDRAVQRLQARGTRVIGAVSTSTGKAKVLKLFQPVHQRYYLVSTCLVCRMLGLPDRRIDAGAQERATFVLRLLQPRPNASKTNPAPSDCDELALVQGKWQVLSNPQTLPAGEEQHALSPASYVEDDLRTRRLLIGLIPVGDRERLLQAVQPNPGGAPALPDLMDAREILLKTQVIGPLCNLETLANDTLTSTNTRPGMPPLTGDQDTVRKAAIPDILTRVNNQIQQMSFYILLDLARYFENNINDLWQAIQSGNASAVQDPAQKQVWNTLQSISYGGNTMIDALRIAYGSSLALDAMRSIYPNPDGANNWPSLQFPFYTVTSTSVQSLAGLSTKADRQAFDDQVVKALVKPAPNPFPQRVVAQANANPQGVAWFTIRCILERPNCGALTPPLVSEPTVAFQLAPFFDPDAPARPIRIGMPIDTTPAGLRKFDRNTAFIMSDTLCGQVTKMSGLSFADLILSVLPWPLHQDLGGGGGAPCPGGGMVCSFSIPIITIVALILLIIFVKLLDIIFFWMPFFQICLPLPNFSAKDS